MGDEAYACARAWVALSTAHARVSERLSAVLAEECGISLNDFEVLLRLDRVPEPGLRLIELQPVVRLTQPSLSRLVARLVEQGRVAREGDPADRRGVRVRLTPAGRDLLRRAVPAHDRIIREALIDRLTATEQDLLATALGRVVADR